MIKTKKANSRSPSGSGGVDDLLASLWRKTLFEAIQTRRLIDRLEVRMPHVGIPIASTGKRRMTNTKDRRAMKKPEIPVDEIDSEIRLLQTS
jgi:hypothetical protein